MKKKKIRLRRKEKCDKNSTDIDARIRWRKTTKVIQILAVRQRRNARNFDTDAAKNARK